MVWTDLVRRNAALVAIATLVITLAAAAYVAQAFAVNTNTADMLARDLPFQQASRALLQAFPQDQNTLVVVIEGNNPDLVEDGAAALADALAAEPARFGHVFYPQGDPFFRRHGLLYLESRQLQRLTDRLAQAQPFLGALAADPSLRGLFALVTLAAEHLAKGTADSGGMALAPLLDAIAGQIEAQAAGRFDRLSWTTLMSGDAIEGAGPNTAPRRLIVLQPPLDFRALRPARAAIEGVRVLAREHGLTAEKGLSVRLTGEVALADDELISARVGQATPELISFTLVSIIAFLCFRSVRLSLAALITVVAGVVWTAALASALVGALNLISLAFFVLFIGFAVDFGIHYALRHKEGLDLGLDPAAALARAAAGVGVALCLCALCAAIGFVSFIPTSYVGLAELGFIAGLGMAVALFTNLTILPALLTLLPVQGSPAGAGRGVGAAKQALGQWIARRPLPILAGTVGLVLAAVAVVPSVRFDFDPLNLKDAESPSVQALRTLMADGTAGVYAIAVLEPSLAQADALAKRARELAEVAAADTVNQFLPVEQDAKLAAVETMALILEPALARERSAPPAVDEIIAALGRLKAALRNLATSGGADAAAAVRVLSAFERLPGEGADPATLNEMHERLVSGLPARLDALRASLTAGPVGLADLPADLRHRWLTEDGRARVEIAPAERVDGDTAALGRFVRAVQKIAPLAVGGPVVIYEGGQEILKSFLQAAATAVVAIAVLLLVVLRNRRDVVFVFIPLALAALFTVAASVVLRVPFNFANVIVLPLLFGLGVTESLNLVVRERQEGGPAPMMATCTPRAVLFSALTMIAAFGTLALSDHPGIASMGLLLAVAITLTLVCTVIVLPALMTAMTQRAAAAARQPAI
ncbi:MAG: MMPL family transporter [Defluviicoccus sp.]